MISPSVQYDDEWIELNSKCYKRLQLKLSYPSSKQVCREFHADHVSLESHEENQFMSNQFLDDKFWISKIIFDFDFMENYYYIYNNFRSFYEPKSSSEVCIPHELLSRVTKTTIRF